MNKLEKILCIILGAIILLGFGIHFCFKALGRSHPVWNVVDSAFRSYFHKDGDASTVELKKLLGGMALGVCHPYDDPYNLSLLKGANIGWVRFDLPGDPPYEVDSNGNPVPGPDGRPVETRWYRGFKERCRLYRDNGYKVLAVTPYPDDMLDILGELEMFRSGTPAFSDRFLKMMEAFAAYYAADLTTGEKLVNCFQISNELTVQKWQGALTLEQVGQYQDVQMKAMHDICRAARVPIGYNIACTEEGMWKYPVLMKKYADDYDYIGLDLYLGCFEGKTRSTKIFDALLRSLWHLTRKPIILAEFGYISTGSPKDARQRASYLRNTFGEEFGTEEKIKANIGPFLDKWESLIGKESSLIREARRKLETEGEAGAVDYVFGSSEISHLYKALPEGYRLRRFDHTEEGQAAFYKDVIDRVSKLDFLCGFFCYCYSDSDTCYQCGQKGCPVETGWGLVSIARGTPSEAMNDTTVRLKPSYSTVRDAFGRILDRQEKTIILDETPRIVNIINFVREIEPRDTGDTRKVLYETTLEQTRLLDEYDLPGTFLLQYDALIDPDYQALMKAEEAKGREVGAWWEITEPHVKAAGMKWRGRFSWDWHANVGFATGYAPAERERLVDVYMEKFNSIFGHYPESVGSWFIDAHTLGYMYDKYGIKASCNCKDQYGTDGYTLWGGYWNQAYYPSRLNAYMPAQTAAGQIPVPIFRMLGSDPIYQYDTGLTPNGQGVVSLEPVYGSAGADRRWVEKFFASIFEAPALGFNYTQAGQENSFTWAAMKEGLEMQMPLIAAYRRKGKIEVMTLADAGKWFSSKYKVTPPTSVACMEDTYGGSRKTIWFDSRFYRLNLLWGNGLLRVRDMHLFNEKIPSAYLAEAGTSTKCEFLTLPVVDGFLWSSPGDFAGIRVWQDNGEGHAPSEIEFKTITSEPLEGEALRVILGTADGRKLTFLLKEKKMDITASGMTSDWCLVLQAAKDKALPLKVEGKFTVAGEQNGFRYGLRMIRGNVMGSGDRIIFSADKEDRITIVPFV